MTSLTNSVVLVTGANGGIGTEFVHGVLARGSVKVYASARNPRQWNDERIVPLTLDVTDADSIAAAVSAAGSPTGSPATYARSSTSLFTAAPRWQGCRPRS
jgi:NAD(P)-dependent dehydrogenase (short-subunit alcohol dehydrogenase family)